MKKAKKNSFSKQKIIMETLKKAHLGDKTTKRTHLLSCHTLIYIFDYIIINSLLSLVVLITDIFFTSKIF